MSLPQGLWLLLGVLAAQLIAIAIFKPMLVWEAGWILLLGLVPAAAFPLAALHRRHEPARVGEETDEGTLEPVGWCPWCDAWSCAQ